LKIIYAFTAALVVSQIISFFLIFSSGKIEDRFASEVDRLDRTIQAFKKPATAEDIAAALIKTSDKKIVGLLADQILADEVYVEKLRGKPGEAPETEEIYQYIMLVKGEEFFSLLEEEFWKKRKAIISENPGLVADVAEAVYRTYGKSLKGRNGKDAQMPQVADIVGVLSKDLEFAQLVAEFKE